MRVGIEISQIVQEVIIIISQSRRKGTTDTRRQASSCCPTTVKKMVGDFRKPRIDGMWYVRGGVRCLMIRCHAKTTPTDAVIITATIPPTVVTSNLMRVFEKGIASRAIEAMTMRNSTSTISPRTIHGKIQMFRMRLLSPRIEMAGRSLAVQTVAGRSLIGAGEWTMKPLIQRKGMETRLAGNVKKNVLVISGPNTMSILTRRPTIVIFGMNKLITSLQNTRWKAVLDNTNRELVEDDIMPVFPIKRRLIRSMAETSESLMSVRNVPRDATIGKPEVSSMRQIRMTASMPALREKDIDGKIGGSHPTRPESRE
jgi:hypothetical protein